MGCWKGGNEGGCYGGVVWEGCWRGHRGDGEAEKGNIVGLGVEEDEISGN